MNQTVLGEIRVTMTAKRSAGLPRKTSETPEGMRALFGANVRKARLKAKLTQVDVQRLTGIRQTYVSELEHGLQNPTLLTMVTIARAVEAELRSLLRHPPKQGLGRSRAPLRPSERGSS